ncbi:tyrosine-type recombinase/integrase [Desulfococcaceae bacterium HSG8]|nr:tyrosine-type recombinase/integrase [Desulfococcaceae bacterium HSG8]
MPGLKKGENFNHPKTGQQIKAEPIKNLKDVRNIKKLLAEKPLDYALFVVGINTNLRASDLLNLRLDRVKNMKADQDIMVREKKTGKEKRITLNRACTDAIHNLCSWGKYKGGETGFLFTGQRGVITVPALSLKVKKWCRSLNLEGNYASHTLRKTWAYHQRVTFGTDLPHLMECLNHSSQKITLAYICIQPEEIRNIYKNQI